MSDPTCEVLAVMAEEAEALLARFSPGSGIYGALRRLKGALREASDEAARERGRRIPLRLVPIVGEVRDGGEVVFFPGHE